MSKSPSVSLVQVEEMKQLVVSGVHPHKIAEIYGISPSTVHNYKTKFRNEGLEFADIRGGRVSSSKEAAVKNIINTTSSELATSGHSGHINSTPSAMLSDSTTPSSMLSNPTHTKTGSTFVVNGTSIHINTKVKSIHIDKTDDSMTFDIIV